MDRFEIEVQLVRHLHDVRRERHAVPVHDNELSTLLRTDYRPSWWTEAERRTRHEIGGAEWSRYRNLVTRSERKCADEPAPEWAATAGEFRPVWAV